MDCADEFCDFPSGEDVEDGGDDDEGYDNYCCENDSLGLEPVKISPNRARTYSERGSVTRDAPKRLKSKDDEQVDEKTLPTEHFDCLSAKGDLVSYEVLMPPHVFAMMDKIITRTKEVMEEVPAATIRLMLGQLKWDTDRLLTRYYENPEKLFADLHVGTVKARSLSINKTMVCDICFLDTKSADLRAADCGHRFCVECWSAYLSTNIQTDISSARIECPSPKCKTYLDDAFVMDFLHGDAVRQRYQYRMASSFVDFHPCMRRCPGPDCLHVFCVAERGWIPLTCEPCRLTFCFLCGEPWHDPLKCDFLKKWLRKCTDDSETCNWISANTKDCPECKSTIEKNGGCNHMTCRKCKHQFCWLCFKKWPHVSGGSCNSYAESTESRAEGPRKALERYLFYFKRYDNHQRSLKFEKKLKEKIADSLDGLRSKFSCSWIELQFLTKSVDVLNLCRQSLMYTYAFAFYIKEGNEKQMFLDNQTDLELAVEKLSRYLETDHTMDDTVVLQKLRQAVQDTAGYVDSRRQKLTQHVHDGYETASWDLAS